MKRTVLFALMIALMPLAGCSGAIEEDLDSFSEFRGRVENARSVTMTAEVTADYGGKISRFTLAYNESAGEGELEVLAPELIAGVTAKRTAETGDLRYDGMILDTGAPGNGGTTPIEALPAVLESIRTGHLEAYWLEGTDESQALVLSLTVSENSIQSLWLDRDEMRPLRAEISSGGRVIISCDITEWKIE